MTPAADTWARTLELLAAADAELEAGAAPASVALAHLGAAIMFVR